MKKKEEIELNYFPPGPFDCGGIIINLGIVNRRRLLTPKFSTIQK